MCVNLSKSATVAYLFVRSLRHGLIAVAACCDSLEIQTALGERARLAHQACSSLFDNVVGAGEAELVERADALRELFGAVKPAAQSLVEFFAEDGAEVILLYGAELCLQAHEHYVRRVDKHELVRLTRRAHDGAAAVGVALRLLVFGINVEMIVEEVEQKVEGVKTAVLERRAQIVLLVLVCALPVARTLTLEALVCNA